jgi:hypothetical protein
LFDVGYSNAGGYCSAVEPCNAEQEVAANKRCPPQTVQPASTATPGIPLFLYDLTTFEFGDLSLNPDTKYLV